MEQTREFDLINYVVKGFFVEVFLSLVQRQARDGSKTGRPKLSAPVILYRQLIAKCKDTYCQAANYTSPKLVHAQQIALYECTKMQTAYFNNIKAQFGNRLRMFLNGKCKKKEESNRLRKKTAEERYADYAMQEIIKRTVTLSCMKVKLTVAKKQIPNDEILNADAKDQIKELLLMYPTEYNFQKASIYYDVKVNPEKYFKAFHKLTELCQANQIKDYQCYPIRSSLIPEYMTLDATIVNYHILKYKNKKENKLTIWGKVIDLEKKTMKNQGIGKTLQFEGIIGTNGIGASIIKQNFDTSRKWPGTDNNRPQKPKKTTIKDDNNVKHIETLTRIELLLTNGRCVLIDPNRRDMLYCMKETSSAENKQMLRFTSICRSKQSRRFRILRRQSLKRFI
ncbi:hypothetical protein RMATCC62417_16114 [Rhizopus microsporus]|nr:hypothetical protein RMATCC62417_16114 [Rhizopus microsporus]